MKDTNHLDSFASFKTVAFDRSDIRKIRLKMIKSSLFFIVIVYFLVCLFLNTNEKTLHNLFSFGGIIYLLAWILPGYLLIKRFGEIMDGIKFLKQGEKFIKRVTIINKEDKVTSGRYTVSHDYFVESESGPVPLQNAYFGKRKKIIFELMLVGSEVEMIYSKDGKKLLDIKVDDSRPA